MTVKSDISCCRAGLHSFCCQCQLLRNHSFAKLANLLRRIAARCGTLREGKEEVSYEHYQTPLTCLTCTVSPRLLPPSLAAAATLASRSLRSCSISWLVICDDDSSGPGLAGAGAEAEAEAEAQAEAEADADAEAEAEARRGGGGSPRRLARRRQIKLVKPCIPQHVS